MNFFQLLPLQSMRRVSSLLFFYLFSLCTQANDQTDIGSVLRLGVSYQKKGQCAHAIKEFKRVIRSRPQFYSVYNRIGACFEILGYPKIAEKYFRKTLEYDPKNSYSAQRLKTILEARNKLNLPELRPDTEIEEARVKDPEIRSRIFFKRAKMIFTMLDNGADLRPYSNVNLERLYSSPSDREGFLVVLKVPDGRDGIFFLSVDAGELEPLFKARGAISSPVRSVSKNEVFFLENFKGKTMLLSIPFDLGKENTSPRQHLQDFQEIKEFFWDEARVRMILSARRSPSDSTKIYSWIPGKKPVKVSFGPGDDADPQVSPDGRWLAFVRLSGDSKELMVRDLKSSTEVPLTSLSAKQLSFCWSRLTNRIYFSSLKSGLEESIVSQLGWVDPLKKRPQILQEQNFHFKNLLAGFNDEYLYYLTDYDNNYEIYRIHLESSRAQRLTMSEQDETQIGLWHW